jgi:glycosyltransferase involved in cell wall biosynthesis
MRIAYVAPFQGAELLRRRPSKLNLALAANLKIELVAELLARRGHDVEIMSQGEVVENSTKFFPAFQEQVGGERRIPVFYASAFPVRYINGYWQGRELLSIFKSRHAEQPFDAAIIYNLKAPQVKVALHVAHTVHLPVIVEFEDDSFVDIVGQPVRLTLREQRRRARDVQVLQESVASICVSPHLQTRFDKDKPSLLLRGTISEEITGHARRSSSSQRKNIVAFSGTFTPSKGLGPLIEGWKTLNLLGWELHLAGDGRIADDLRRQADSVQSIKFRGLLNRDQNAAFLAEAKIGINPHELSATPGNVFAFKIIEYLAAGLHVISTPMGPLEAELEAGITYIEDNSAARIATALGDVIQGRHYERLAIDAAERLYGGEAVATALDSLLRRSVG